MEEETDMILDRFVLANIQEEIPFAEQRIRDYFSPRGNFPEKMYLAKELTEESCRVPKGYTEQDTRELLAMFSCSDECLEGVTSSGSSSNNHTDDPRLNKILVQVAMMQCNSLGDDDFNRQKGISEGYLRARKKFNELSGQMEQGNLAEVGKLFSEGLKNILTLDKSLGRQIAIKRGDYAGIRLVQLGLDFLEKHPEIRDPSVLTDQDMEDMQIIRSKVAFFRDAGRMVPEYREKLERGEAFTEEELAEILLLNQISAASGTEEVERNQYIQREMLKAEPLPGGLPMPIGQTVEDIAGMVYTQGDPTEEDSVLPLDTYLGRGESKRYRQALDSRASGIALREGYGNVIRAFLLGYPQSKETLLEKVKESSYFREMKELQEKVQQGQAKAEELVDALETRRDQGIFDQKTIQSVLRERGIPEHPVAYHVEAIPENREYAEALEAERRGESLQSEVWQKRFEQQKAQIETRAKELGAERRREKNLDTLSFDLSACFREAGEDWSRPYQESEDALKEFLRDYPGCAFMVDKEGKREILNPAGADTKEIEDRLLNMDGKTWFFRLPVDIESSSPVWAITVDMKNLNNAYRMDSMEDYIREQTVQKPQKPSLWTRMFAFLVPGYRAEVDAYEEALRKFNESVEKVTVAKKVLEDVKKENELQTETMSEIRQEAETDLSSLSAEEADAHLEEIRSGRKQEKLQNLLERYEELLRFEEPEYQNRKLEKLISAAGDDGKENLSGDKSQEETATLALLNSITNNNVRQGEQTPQEYLKKVLQPETAPPACPDRMRTSYREIRQKMESGETKLLPADRLRNFCNTLMNPEIPVAEFAAGAILMHELGEAKILQAIGEEKITRLPREIRGIMEYGGIFRKSLETGRKETTKALKDPEARPDAAELLDVMIIDSIDRERVVLKNLKRNERNQMVYTPLLGRLGKIGIEAFRKEVKEAVGPDYLEKQAAMGSAEFALHHRLNLGISATGDLTKQLIKENTRKIKMEQQKTKQAQPPH